MVRLRKALDPIDMLFFTYSELPLFFQPSVITWYLTVFPDNHSYVNDVTSDRNLGFYVFRLYSNLSYNTVNDGKTAFSEWN